MKSKGGFIMEKHEYILGIDIGGTSIKIGVVKEGKVI